LTDRAAPLLLLILLATTAAAPPAPHNIYPWTRPTTWDVRLNADPDEPGWPFTMSGRVFGLDSLPAAGITLYVYHADAGGLYARKSGDFNRLANVLRTDSAGRYRIRSVVPGQYEGPSHVHFEVWNGLHPVRATFVSLYNKPGKPSIGAEARWADHEWGSTMGILTADSSDVFRCTKDLRMSDMTKMPASYDSLRTAERHKLEPWIR